MSTRAARCENRDRRRAGVYVAVLSISMFVLVAGVGALLAAQANLARTVAVDDALDAQVAAASGIELGRLLIQNDPNWRTTFTSGVWRSGLALGEGSVTISGIDPNDGDLDNRPHDRLVLRATGRKGAAQHAAEVELVAAATPLDALKYGLHTAGQLHVRSGQRLAVRGAAASTDGALRNDNVIFGDVIAASVTASGLFSGSLTTSATVEPFPTIDTAELYAALGTAISPGKTMASVSLSPQSNPYGSPDPDGVYVIRQDTDLTIEGVALSGTLIVISPGRKISVKSTVSLDPARTDYPVLVIVGNVEFLSGGVAVPKAGATLGVRGLVHVRGTVKFSADPQVTGIMLVESTAATDAVDVSADVSIKYDAALFRNPPQGYAKSVEMKLQPASWRRVFE